MRPPSQHEFRVVWKREGLSRRTKLYQSRAPAESFVLYLEGKMEEATGDDPDAYACCSGWECGCGGVTNAQAWAQRAEGMPPLVEPPTIQIRDVGPWRVIPSVAQPTS